MRYLGGKYKIKKHLHKYFNKVTEGRPFVDLFCGACNIVEGITTATTRYANDNNPYLIAMFKALQDGWEPPKSSTKEDYLKVRADFRDNTNIFPDELKGFYGHGLTFGGRWFDSYAKDAEGRDYTVPAYNSLQKQRPLLKDILFTAKDYKGVDIPDNAVVYCDIPYRNTTCGYYTRKFDHTGFYKWVEKNKDKFDIYISEYKENVPDNFEIVWEKDSSNTLSRTAKTKKKTTEVLIRPK